MGIVAWLKRQFANREAVVALLLFVVGAVVSGVAAWWFYVDAKQSEYARFSKVADSTVHEVEGRFRQVALALSGVQGLFVASQHVGRQEFASYVEQLDLKRAFPGLRGMGFVRLVPAAERDAYEAAQRADGAPGFRIRPLDAPHGDTLYVAQFVASVVGGAGVLGLDLATESRRRVAMDMAIETGQPAMTYSLTLVTDERKLPSWLVFVPVYAAGQVPVTAAERRAALRGLIFASMVVPDFMQAIPEVANGWVDLELFDDAQRLAALEPVFDADNHLALAGAGKKIEHRFSASHMVGVPGRMIGVRVNSLNLGHSHFGYWLALGVLVCGLAMSALLANLVWQIGQRHRLAQDHSKTMQAQAWRLAQVVERTSSAVTLLDCDGCITWVNPSFTRMTGYTLDEVMGKPLSAFRETIDEVRSGDDRNLLEVFARAKDGREYWVETELQPLYGENGDVADFVEVSTDITDRKRAVVLAQEVSKTKSQFLANMSHEIRTPMNAILGMLKLLTYSSLNPRQSDYVHKAEGAAQSLLGLLNDILDFSKIEAGKMELDLAPFSVRKLAEDLRVILFATLGSKPVDLVVEIDPQMPAMVVGDSLRLQQILINLGGNAVKFTLQGQVVVSWQVLHKDADAVHMRIAVRDSGIGIAPENQEKIFTGFSQAEASTTRRFGGSGLGLSICRHLIAMMGGDLRLDSVLGQGSTFSFEVTLPIAAMEEPQSASAASVASRLDGLRLLLAEDNPINQQVAYELLRKVGATVQLVDDGQQAVEAVQNTQPPFDAVLMDMQMPVMDGCTASRTLRSMGYTDLPIVAMTANAMAADVQACMEAGMNDHVGKPFELQRLVEAILQAVGREPGGAPVAPAEPVPAEQAVPPALPELEGWDVAGAVARMGDDRDLYAAILQDFRTQLAQEADAFAALVAQADRAVAVRQMHTLKSVAGSVGALGMQAFAAAAEKALKTDDAVDLQAMLADLRSQAEHTDASLAQLIGALGESGS